MDCFFSYVEKEQSFIIHAFSLPREDIGVM